MPGTVKAACILIVLSVLQGIINLRFIYLQTAPEAVFNIAILCVLVALTAGIGFHRSWARWIYIGLTIVGLLLFVLGFFAGINLRQTGAMTRYVIEALDLTVLRSLLQLISIVLLLTKSAWAWFERREQRQAAH
jgi:hypothetical protein